MFFPKVSIIIPFFNSKKFLREALESVFSQTYTDWELLLVDDGSTDGSELIAIQAADQNPFKVRYLFHQGHENQGVPKTRNLGYIHSRGELIALLDSDDLWLPQKLEKQVSILDEYPEADALYGETLYWYSWTGEPEDKNRDFVWDVWKVHDIQPDTIVQPPRLLTPLLEYAVCPCPCSVLLRSEVIKRIGGWENIFRNNIYEDQAFYLKLYLNASVYVDSNCLEKYRQHKGSMCYRTEKEGNIQTVRLFFLNWAQKYLSKNGYHDLRTKEYLEAALLPYRHPVFSDQVELPIPVGQTNFGNLRRLTPVSRNWGFDRVHDGQPGQPIDRYYIEAFLHNHMADIKGRVLEIGDSNYTRKFGGDRVLLSEVLNADPDIKEATYNNGDLVTGMGFPKAVFDCFILTQTLLLIYDIQSAVWNAYAALKPGGVLLATIPGISQICRREMELWGDYWRFTSASVRRLFGDIFGESNITVTTYGNVFTTSAFLFGLTSHELKIEELDFHDPDYQVTIAVRAIKPENEIEKIRLPNLVLEAKIQFYKDYLIQQSDQFGQVMKKLDAQIAEKDQELAERDQELSEIKKSKVYRLALYIRWIRLMLIPPGSFRARASSRLGELFIIPFRKYQIYRTFKNDITIVKSSDLFDEDWYFANYPDVAQAKVDAVTHYLRYGGFERRDPGPYFSSGWYLDTYEDVRKAKINPLVHYLQYGVHENRHPYPPKSGI
jgi:glycosyltransferase involved in cell wall biosynthesis